MAYETKTKVESEDVRSYILSLEPEKRRVEGLRLLEIFEEECPWPAKLWSGGMIGFGEYTYKYKSGHGGTALRVGFAPRKPKYSIYTWLEEDEREALLSRFGKHSTGVGCIYVNKLADIDENVLREMIRAAIKGMEKHYPEEG